MSNHKINIEVLSPIHVGTGEAWKGNYEYLLFEEERVIIIIDEEKVLDLIGEENLNQWINIIEKQDDLLSFLRRRKSDLKPSDIAHTIIPINGSLPSVKNDIKSCIKNVLKNSAYLPGSSLKGSMRSAALTKMILDAPDFVNNREHLGSFRKGSFRYSDQQINANYFGGSESRRGLRHDPNKDWFRFLRVVDSKGGETQVYKSSILNLLYDDWKVKDSSYLECLATGESLEGELKISEKQMDEAIKIRLIRPSRKKALQLENLFPLINKHTKGLVEAEKRFMEFEENPTVFENYSQHIETLLANIESCSARECILRVGAGSGWNFITGGWASDPDALQNDNLWFNLLGELRRKRYHKDVPFPKTRKLIEGGVPMGFLKMSLA